MYIDSVLFAVIEAFNRVITLMQDTAVFHIGIGLDQTITVSVFDICIAGMLLDLVLYVAFPWFGGNDDD